MVTALLASTVCVIAERDTVGRIFAILGWLAVLILYRSRAFV
jgi:hypothetical protein